MDVSNVVLHTLDSIFLYSIVPYVNPPFTGSISGIIGAGGNVGAAVFSTFFRQMPAKVAFTMMGIMIVVSSILSVVVFIPGHTSLLYSGREGQDDSSGNDDASKDARTESDVEQCSSGSINDTSSPEMSDLEHSNLEEDTT